MFDPMADPVSLYIGGRKQTVRSSSDPGGARGPWMFSEFGTGLQEEAVRLPIPTHLSNQIVSGSSAVLRVPAAREFW